MESFVALLRGINVGGGNKVPMAELRALAAGLGWQGVQTYIAFGNLVFRAGGAAAEHAAALSAALAEVLGLRVPILVLSAAEFRARLATCPFPPEAGKAVHGFLLFGEARIDCAMRDALTLPEEVFVAAPGVVWLLAPGGIGRSKPAGKLHKVILGCDVTGRNLNSFHALAAMLDAAPAG